MTKPECARRVSKLYPGTLIEHLGIKLLSAGGGKARAKLKMSPAVTQPTGLFHGGAIVALADTTATSACIAEINPDGDNRPDLFPLTIQISSNFVRNTKEGGLVADAGIIHHGRTTMVVGVRVADERGRLVANVVATLLVPPGISAKVREPKKGLEPRLRTSAIV